MEPEPTYFRFPEIITAALKDRKSRKGRFMHALRLWLHLCTYTYPLQIPLHNLLLVFDIYFDIHKGSVYPILAAGDACFWDFAKGTSKQNPGMLTVYTPDQVARALGLASKGPSHERPLSEICGQDYMRKLYRLTNDYYRGTTSSMTRGDIAARTGIPIRSQQCYNIEEPTLDDANLVLREVHSTLKDCQADIAAKAPDKSKYVALQRKIHIGGVFKELTGIFEKCGNNLPAGASGLVEIGTSCGSTIWATPAKVRNLKSRKIL